MLSAELRKDLATYRLWGAVKFWARTEAGTDAERLSAICRALDECDAEHATIDAETEARRARFAAIAEAEALATAEGV